MIDVCGALAVDWSKTWQAVEAIGTAAAFIVAASVFAFEAWRRRRLQAEHVAAWMEPAGTARRPRSRVVVRNGSTEPVFSVRVAPTTIEIEPMFLSALPPETTHGEDAGVELFAVQGSNVFSADVELTFTDAGNRAWRRAPGGRLRRVRPGATSRWPRLAPGPRPVNELGETPVAEELEGSALAMLSGTQRAVYVCVRDRLQHDPSPVNVAHIAEALHIDQDAVGFAVVELEEMGLAQTSGEVAELDYPIFVVDLAFASQ